MGISCGQGLASHNASTTAHAAGITTAANLYVAAAGKLGWSDAYLTRNGAGEIGSPGHFTLSAGKYLMISTTGGIEFGDAATIRLAAHIIGLGTGDSIVPMLPHVDKSANYNLTASDVICLVTTAAGAITIGLPAVASSLGQWYHIKKVDAGAGTVVIDGNAAETIDGAASYTLTLQYECITCYCDGAAWWIV